MKTIDTRVRIFLLLDYKEYYGVEKTLSDAEDLVKEIPSATLLNYLAGFSVNLYLRENNEDTGKIQFMLVNSLLGKCDKTIQQKWATEVKRQSEKGHMPLMFWNYSNLLFYGLIFKKFNTKPSRDLTSEEAKKFFDAYLIVNGFVNNKTHIESETIQKADEEAKLEEVIMPSFIYQKDYSSSVDFTNQVTRGIALFSYLEADPKYRELVHEYYKLKRVKGYLRMFRNLMVLFSEINLGKDLERRNQLASLEEYFKGGEIDLDYIETLCINSEISSYKEDESFGIIRSNILYKLDKFKFLILDVNFLLDQFYKAQVFSFNSFLKLKGAKVDFLSEKGKNFTENIYLPSVLNICFPGYIKFYGDSCLNSNKEELCDAYLREKNKICLIEFKDVLLNAAVKNSADKEKLFAEFDKKFSANQAGKAKGITQLLNAVQDIDKSGISFDNSAQKEQIEIYPVIVYTDSSFGMEGINKIFKERFSEQIKKLKIQNVTVKDVVFINLNFFEVREDYFSKKILDLFNMLDGFYEHIKNPNYVLTPFEVYSRLYMNIYVPEELGSPSSFQKAIRSIIYAK